MYLYHSLFLCLFAMLHYIVATHAMHGNSDRRVMSARIRSQIRIGDFPSSRNSVRRNFEAMGPNFSIFHRRPSRRFQGSLTPSRNPHVHSFHANIRSSWPAIPVRRPSIARQAARRRLVVDIAKNPFSAAHTGNSINGIQHKNVMSQTDKNSLLKLLEERRPVLRDENDALLIRTHLIELNKLKNSELTNIDKKLQEQVNYIERIMDTDIRREVLKLFVKDIVEKSGFLDTDLNTVPDIGALKLLVDKIKMITDKFTNMEKVTLGTSPGPEAFHTTTVRDNARQEAELRQRISVALSLYDRSGHSPDTGLVDSNVGLRDLQTYRGRVSVGRSIFRGTDIPTSTVQSVTKGVKREIINAEPVGGNGTYWTHLSTGLNDMLCSLCQQHGVQSCILRYCTNAVSPSASRVDPQTQSSQTVIAITTPSTS